MPSYVPLPAFRAGAPLDFGGLNDSLDFIIKEKEKNRLLGDRKAALSAVYGQNGQPLSTSTTNALLGGPAPSPAAAAQAQSVVSRYSGPANQAQASAAAAGRDYQPDVPDLALIKHFEGYTPTAKDDYGQTSIGYSTRARPGQTTIDKGEAEQRLREEVAPVRSFLDQNVPGIDPVRKAALTSAGINLGTGPGGINDFIPAAQAGDWNGVANKLLGYNHAGGQVNPGLTSRRGIEAQMIRDGSSPAAAPSQPQAPQPTPAAPPASPGPNWDAGIAIAARNGDVQTLALLQEAKQHAEAQARLGRLDERQLRLDEQTGQLNSQKLQEGEMALHDKLALKAAGVAQMVLQAPAEQKASMAQKLYAVHPEFPAHLKAAGVNPDDIDQSMNFLIAEARGLPAKEDPTNDMREYSLAKKQGFHGTILDYQTALKQAGRPQNVVTVSGDKKGAEEMAKLHAKEYETIRTGANKARSDLANLDALEGSLDAGLNTGAFGETEQGLRKAAVYFGVGNADKVAAGDLAAAVSNKLALAVRTPNADGGGMPGAMSDADREFLKSTVPGLARTPGGNEKIIDIARKLGQRSIDIHKLAVKYAQEHDGQLDPGFEAEVNDFAEKNPIFAKETNSLKNSAPKQLGRGDKAAYDALPSGASFIDPEGNPRIKP